RRAVHASESVRGRVVSEAPRAPTSNTAAAVAMAMRRRRRLLPKLGRCALLTPGRFIAPIGLVDPGVGFVPASVGFVPASVGLDGARHGGSAGRRRRHAAQTPLSPGAASYKAPQLVHPSTEAGVFMLPNLPARRPAILCQAV